MLKLQLTSVFNQVHPIESSHQVKLSSILKYFSTILKYFSTINLKVTLCNCQHPILQELCPWAWPGSWSWRRWGGGCGWRGAGRGWCSWYLLVICEHCEQNLTPTQLWAELRDSGSTLLGVLCWEYSWCDGQWTVWTCTAAGCQCQSSVSYTQNSLLLRLLTEKYQVVKEAGTNTFHVNVSKLNWR